ncbi:hypothetical protein EPN95_03610 [Patescibacteria group bacterium]|nr:MAG: hypothetical protein EPN95_03610 [Patescibacteria group bacterium]
MSPRFHNILRVAKGVALRNSLVSRRRRQVILKFANKFSFVYFGHVDQHDDEHHIIRGLTVSASHQDEHYSVGSFEGYDVSLVDRYDILSTPRQALRTHRWIIIEIDLHNGRDIPHIFLGGHNHQNSSYSKLFTSVPSLQRVPLGTFGAHSEEFTSRYSLFATATQFIEVERLFTTDVTRTIAAHFWPLAVEVFEGALYVYADNQSISVSLLETMLKNGLWLAQKLDEHSYPTDSPQLDNQQ